jgi:hypothetical protein
MRSKFKRILAVIGLAGLLAVPAGAAWAEDPVTIPSGTNIVDNANVLGSRKGEVQDAIQKLLKDHKYNLYVVTVKSFENPSDPAAWSNAVAQAKGMGKADVILAIATDQGKYYFSPNSASAIYSKRSNITQNAIVANLAGGKKDFAQAAIDTASAVGDAAGGGSGNVSSGAGAGAGVLVGAGVVVAGGGAYLYYRNRRKKAAAGQAASSGSYGPQGAELDPLASLSVEELRRKSGSLLIEADDAIKSSEQELGFAQAQYGDAAVGNFTKALAEAKAHMTESFKLQQQLDDHIPDTEEQKRTRL